MAWFWKKQPAEPQAPAEAAAAHAVDQAVADAQCTDKEWQRQAARQAQEKRREKEHECAAKMAMKEMQKQVKTARKERKAAEKRVKKQARAVLKLQRKELKAQRKRVKVATKAVRREEKRRRQLVRRRQKEERRRRKRMRQQDSLLRERDQAVIETEELRNMTIANAATVMAAGVIPAEAPKFKEDKRCKSCYLQFQRLPTRRRHHCRNCGDSFCSKCLSGVKRPIPWFKLDKPQKVCFSCDVSVFNGMGGTSRTASASAPPESPLPSAPTPVPEDAAVPLPPQLQRQPSERSPLHAQRSSSFQSEQPEDSPRSSPNSRSGLSFRLRPRSRREQSSSKGSKKGSLWTLPIRPLLKRKASADQLRNRSWDFDLRIEKEEMLARQRKSQMILSRGPQIAQAS